MSSGPGQPRVRMGTPSDPAIRAAALRTRGAPWSRRTSWPLATSLTAVSWPERLP